MWALLLIPRSLPSGICGKHAAWSTAIVLQWQWETADARPWRSVRNNTCSPSNGDNSVRKLWQPLLIWDIALMDKSIQRTAVLATLRTLDNFHHTVWQEIKGKDLLEIPLCQQCTWMVSAFCEEIKNKAESKLSVPTACKVFMGDSHRSWINIYYTPFCLPDRKTQNQHWCVSCYCKYSFFKSILK